MSFYLSKMVWVVASPGNLLVLLSAVGLILGRVRGRWGRLGRILQNGGIAGLAMFAILPLGDWLGRPLENRFLPPPSLPQRVGGIIVLGGAVDPAIAITRGIPAVNGAAERLLAFVALAHHYPDAPLIASGGTASLHDTRFREGEAMRMVLEQAGMDTGRVLFENQSRNTWENALFSRSFVALEHGLPWVLITSAAHMPRSVAIFRHLNWPVIPYPVDYRTRGDGAFPDGIDLTRGLDLASVMLREWLGLAAYRVQGRIDDAWPAP